jgi:hypothetical protein
VHLVKSIQQQKTGCVPGKTPDVYRDISGEPGAKKLGKGRRKILRISNPLIRAARNRI